MRTPRPLAAAASLTLLATSLALAPAALATERPPNEIVGGGPASEPHPYSAVFLRPDGRPWCGGVLISPTWIFTAWHCVPKPDAGQFRVRVGSADRTQGGEVVDVAEWIGHQNNTMAGSDIAAVRLAQPVNAQPLALTPASPAPGSRIRVIGWGKDCADTNCDMVPGLKELDTTALPADRCTADEFVTGREICMDNPAGQGACKGDSGSGVLIGQPGDWRLAGLVSRGPLPPVGCGGRPAVATDVVAFREWVRERTGV